MKYAAECERLFQGGAHARSITEAHQLVDLLSHFSGDLLN